MNIQKIATAAFLALAFAACSEDLSGVTPESGVSPEEPNGKALVSDTAKVAVDSVAKKADSTTAESDSVVYKDIRVQHFKGWGALKVFGLNSETMDTTRNLYCGDLFGLQNDSQYYDYDDDGVFVVDSVVTESPYVMARVRFSVPGIEPELYNIAVVDIRQTKHIVVNVKTNMEGRRIIHLVKSGMNFVDAKLQAEKELSEVFGFYNGPLEDTSSIDNEDYQDYINFMESFLENTTADTVLAKFERCGSITCNTEMLKKRFLSEGSLLAKTYNMYLSSPVEEYEKIGNTKFYQKASRGMTLLANFFAGLSDLGKCTAEKEGSTLEISSENIILSCSKNNWSISYKSLPHSVDAMTDARDGKTYKTVTYDIGGKPMVWMAENLGYAGSDVQNKCIKDSYYLDPSPLRYGVDYCFEDMTKLDSSMFLTVEACVEREFQNEAWGDLSELDSSRVWNYCRSSGERLDKQKYMAYADSIWNANGFYQGICPDGWHIPDRSEWDALLNHLIEYYVPRGYKEKWPGDKYKQVIHYLFSSSLGNPAGFGLSSQVYEAYNDETSFRDRFWYAVVDKGRATDMYISYQVIWSNVEIGTVADVDDLRTRSAFVRCVKN